MSLKSVLARLWRHTLPARCLETLRWQFRRVRLHPSSLLLINEGILSIGKGTKIGPRCVFEAQASQLNIGSNCWFYRDIELRTNTGIRVGPGSTFQTGVLLNGSVSIGAGCIFAPRVFVSSGTHIFRWQPALPIRLQEALYSQSSEGGVPYDDKPVFIGEDCWLGVNAVIMPGVTIGRGSVIGANSVVTSDIPPYSIAAGAPARVLKKRLDWAPPTKVDCTRASAAPYLYSGFILAQRDGELHASAGGDFTIALPSTNFDTVELRFQATGPCSITIAGQRLELPGDGTPLRANVTASSLSHEANGTLLRCSVHLASSSANPIRLHSYAVLDSTNPSEAADQN